MNFTSGWGGGGNSGSGGGAAPWEIIPSGINAVTNLFGLLQGSQRTGDLLRSRNTAASEVRDYLANNLLPPGYASNVYQQLVNPWLDMNNSYRDQSQGLLDQYLGSLSNYSNNLDRITTPQENPLVAYLRSQMEQNNAQLNPSIENFLSIANSGGVTQNNQSLFDTLMSHGSTANPYISNLLDIGGTMLQTGGLTPYTQNALDVSGYFMRNGGMTNDDRAGMGMGSQLFGAGQNTLAAGNNLLNSTQSTGGWDQNTQNLFNTGMQGIQGMPAFFNQDPMSVLGGTGQQAINGLMNNQFTQGGYNTTLNALNDFRNRPNISENDQSIIDNSFGRLFQNIDLSDMGLFSGMGTAQQTAGQNVNSLAPWFSQMQGQGNALMNQFRNSTPSYDSLASRLPDYAALQSQIDSYFNNADSAINALGGMSFGGGGGGGGGSVSYTPMSRDLGPVDPKIQEYFEKALAEFDRNPMMADSEATSMARSQAANDVRQQALAAGQRINAIAGPAPMMGAGTTASALRSFADQSIKAQGDAYAAAMKSQQDGKLARSGMASQLAQALGALKGNREQLFSQMNIADANNATQAGIANAQLAESSAGRQAQMAQISSALAQARAQLAAQMASGRSGAALDLAGLQQGGSLNIMNLLKDYNLGNNELTSGIFSNLLNSATTQRGQNVTSQGQGFDAMVGLQNAANGRQENLGNLMSGAAGRGQDMYNANLTAASNALGQLGQYGTQRNTALNSVLESLLGASGQITSRGNNMMNAYTSMATGASGNAATRYGAGLGAAADIMGSGLSGMNAGLTGYNNSVGNANNRLGHYADIFGAAQTSADNRMTLGANMTNQGLGAMNNFLTGAQNAANSQQTYARDMGALAAQLTGQRNTALDSFGQNALGFANNDLGNRTLLGNSLNNISSGYNNAYTGLNSAWQQANVPYQQLTDQTMQYLTGAQNLYGPYMNMFGLSGGVRFP